MIIDEVVEAVRADLLQRSQVGIKKYNTTLERTDLELKDWLQHAYEEALDMANYLKRSIIELEKNEECPMCHLKDGYHKMSCPTQKIQINL